MKTTYEWDIETLDLEGEDIIDHNFAPRLSALSPDLLHAALHADETRRVVLVRNTGDDVHGLTDRLWAYVRFNGTLPECFEDGGRRTSVRVPAKYREELKRAFGRAL